MVITASAHAESNTSPTPMMSLDAGTQCISGLLHSPWWISSSSALSTVRAMRLLSPGIVVFPCFTLQVPFWCQVPFDHICATLPCCFCSASWQAVAFEYEECAFLASFAPAWIFSICITPAVRHYSVATIPVPSPAHHLAPSSPAHLSCYSSATFS